MSALPKNPIICALGATGKFPEGKDYSDDEGELQFAKMGGASSGARETTCCAFIETR
jgi:hypothetical protein